MLKKLILSALALTLAVPAFGATVYVGQRYYALDNGLRTDNPWDVYEEIVYNKDVAIIVMREDALQSRVNDIIETLEKMNIPMIFTKQKNYDEFVKRGILVPTALPKK